MSERTGDEGIMLLQTPGERDPHAVLAAARNEPDLKSVVVLAWRTDGSLYMETSCAALRDLHWLIANGNDEVWRAMRHVAEHGE